MPAVIHFLCFFLLFSDYWHVHSYFLVGLDFHGGVFLLSGKIWIFLSRFPILDLDLHMELDRFHVAVVIHGEARENSTPQTMVTVAAP